jgi:hypothetical protein
VSSTNVRADGAAELVAKLVARHFFAVDGTM